MLIQTENRPEALISDSTKGFPTLPSISIGDNRLMTVFWPDLKIFLGADAAACREIMALLTGKEVRSPRKERRLLKSQLGLTTGCFCIVECSMYAPAQEEILEAR